MMFSLQQRPTLNLCNCPLWDSFVPWNSTGFTSVQCEGWLGLPVIKEISHPSTANTKSQRFFFPSLAGEDFCYLLLIHLLALHISLLYEKIFVSILLVISTGHPNFPVGIKTQSSQCSGNRGCSQLLLSSLGLCSCSGGGLWSFSWLSCRCI